MENQKRERLFNSFGDVNMENDEILEVKNSSRTLWTEKYAPNNFLDLLSDDETNRLVLLWLRLWDGFAFKKKGGVVFWESLEEKDKKLVEIDHLRGGFVLPKQRILVLHGSSGAGKSSLAFVVARQLGYRPLSIQISEIQNVAELRNRMENAINSIEISSLFLMQKQQQTPKTKEDKPVCFIIEGLELATSDMIQFLCSWTKRSSSNGSILRPQLRISSLALQVQPCNQKRLKARLLEICRFEGILIDQNQLNEMILTHGTDIHLCLNTLQFMTANAVGTAFSKKNSTPSDDIEQPQKLNTALSVSFIDVLYSIFTLDFHKDSRGIVQSPKQRANTILYLINRLAFEEFTRIQQLIFVNVASVFKLGHEQSTKISKIFISMDLLQSHIQQNQNYFLFRYLPYALISIHFICAMHVSRRLKFDMNTQLFNNFVLPKVEPKIHQQASQIVKIKPNNLTVSKTQQKLLNTTIPFIFRYSAGTSQTIRRRVLIGDIFR
uniref:AAA+ ATPase domain-containing protein n=1 Tax=Meloidogyne javanica TaxID=6303 RepID=A0A915M9P2_MELJA